MKRVLLFVFIGVFFFLFSSTANAQGLVECDACGYCYASQQAPGNWDSCRKCLYPEAGGPTPNNQTLEKKPNPTSGLSEQVTKAPGKYYTQLGCIDTGMTSFTDPTAAGGVLNFLLTRFIFPTVGVLSFLSLIYGAFLLITAQSEPEQIARGRSYIVGAIVGLIFTLSVILLINIIAGDILRIPGFTRTPQAQIAVRATTATVNGSTVYPILGVSYNGKEIESLTLESGTQNVSINVPVSAQELSKPEVLSTIIFTMENDSCYSISSTRNPPTCCDPAIAASKPQCADTENYNGDVNMYISEISINGKKCTGYKMNGQDVSPIISIHSFGVSITCTAISNN